MSTISSLLSVLLLAVTAATTTLAAPVDIKSNANAQKQQQGRSLLATRQTDNFYQAVAGPPTSYEIGWLFGALLISWGFIFAGVILLRKTRLEMLNAREIVQATSRDKEEADTYRTMS